MKSISALKPDTPSSVSQYKGRRGKCAAPGLTWQTGVVLSMRSRQPRADPSFGKPTACYVKDVAPFDVCLQHDLALWFQIAPWGIEIDSCT